MIKVFNSTFENSLRMILLLNEFDSSELLDRLYTTDFLAVYGRDFGVASENLNGDNDFKYSEFQSRKTVCRNALKELVLNGLVTPIKDQTGIRYQINDAGKEYADSLQSEYAVAYRENADAAIKYVEKYSDRQIISMINRMSTDSVRGGSHE
jgi:hypothetical protein